MKVLPFSSSSRDMALDQKRDDNANQYNDCLITDDILDDITM